MQSVTSFFACAALTAGLAGLSTTAALAAQGKDFPGTTCTCQNCGSGGGDITGNCANVCTDKTVYSAGSEPHDYCKAKAKTVTGNNLRAAMNLAGLTTAKLALASKVSPAIIIRMEGTANKPFADAATIDKVIQALKLKGVAINEDGVHLVPKPLP